MEKGENMSWIGKWKESKEKQKAKDIEHCRQHPKGWKIMMGIFAFAFVLLIIFMSLSGAYPLAAIAFVFAMWMAREYIKVYREAFPEKRTAA